MLEAAAAAQWKVPVSEVQAKNHQVVHTASGRTLGYGALVAAAAALPVPAAADVKLKPRSAWRYIGKSQPLIDGKDIVSGKAVFGIDARLPGTRFAVIARPPVYGGKLVSVDSTETMKVPGVVKVVTLEGAPPPSAFRPLGGVAVIAKNTWAAIQGREKLKLTWDDGPNASYSSEPYKAALVASSNKPGTVARNEGDVGPALTSAARTVRADYYAPHLTHSSIEPPAALADVTADGCRVWACTQGPQGARDELARTLGLPPEKVTVNVTLLGGGFGRKSKPDFIVEAALLSKDVGGPVHLTWTREDEIQNAYFHTVTAMHFEAGLDASGRATAWLGRTAFPCISTVFAPNLKTPDPGELDLGFTDVPYAIPNVRIEACDAEAHSRIGWFRSVSNIPHVFGVCSFADELAHAAGKDPKEYLLELIGPARHVELKTTAKYGNYGGDIAEYPIDTGRLRGVVEAAAAKAGWGRKLPARHGLGHRRAPELPHLRLHHRRSRRRGRRHPHGASGRDRHRLRHLRARRPDPLADGRRGGDGHLDGPLRQHHVQERPDRAEQLRHLRAGPHAGRARHDRDGARRERRPAGRGRGAGAAGLRAGALQRHLRRHRQAAAHAADREEGVS